MIEQGDPCPFCGGEIEFDGENSWRCTEYELHRGTLDEPEDALIEQINALQDEIERLKKQLIAESVCRQPEECGKYDWLIEERNAEIALLNDKLKASENKFHRLKMFIVDVVAHIRHDMEKKKALIMTLEGVLK